MVGCSCCPPVPLAHVLTTTTYSDLPSILHLFDSIQRTSYPTRSLPHNTAMFLLLSVDSASEHITRNIIIARTSFAGLPFSESVHHVDPIQLLKAPRYLISLCQNRGPARQCTAFKITAKIWLNVYESVWSSAVKFTEFFTLFSHKLDRAWAGLECLPSSKFVSTRNFRMWLHWRTGCLWI